ncbi:MAG: 3-methyl-2-oxobutanoate hydroxymethyltransferase [Pseudomonadota bacterium]|nr:3-methyl-2-oxobutanoate hydroxymethyltransferase [Pseudomonadota bacterium]
MSTAPITVSMLAAMKQRGERIASLTCYDASFCRLLERAGVEVLLVGDSLGMVLQGQDTTLSVTLDHMVYHTACVARARRRALILADLPFLSYATPERALQSAGRLMQEGGAHMVKLEGGAPMTETVRLLSEQGIPVCAHLGLLPQFVHRMGGYRYQGRDQASAQAIRNDALALQDAGAALLVLECVPAELASEISRALTIPVIGIGAGSGCDGQVLVLQDTLGLNPGNPPSFSKDFMTGQSGIAAAVGAYVQAVKSGAFPGPEQTRF